MFGAESVIASMVGIIDAFQGLMKTNGIHIGSGLGSLVTFVADRRTKKADDTLRRAMNWYGNYSR